jgi:hypothetical protein
MNETLPPIYFYIPEDINLGHIPKCAAEYWNWRVSKSKEYRFLGNCDWTLQTYLRLNDTGFPCHLTRTPPVVGIVIAHKDFLERIMHPSSATLLVCLKSDRTPHPYAQVHVVQNPQDRVEKIQAQLVASFFVPHWLQSSIIPRNRERGDRFENIGYLGSEIELAEEFKKESWKRSLKDLDFNWITSTNSKEWSNFEEIDALVAIRKCNSKIWEYNHKPASKLYNAWHADIPAILGSESAYMAERKNEFDYLEANSPEEVIRALQRLRDDRKLRESMVINGRSRARETKNEVLVKKWGYFLTDVASPAYGKWCNSTWIRKKYFAMCVVRRVTSRTKRGVLKISRTFSRS